MSSPNSTAESALAAIAAHFESHFRERLRPIRQVGREAEFPVVTRDGRAADVNLLWEPLLQESGFVPLYDDPQTQSLLVGVERAELNLAVEVGCGTIELSLGPYDDLWELQAAHTQAIELVSRLAASRGLYLLGFGIQPRTSAATALMTPRPRYHALYRAIGAPWLRLTTTASDQTHVDICRAELLDAINWMNLLSAPLIALCANSSVYAGRPGQFVSGREGLLRDLGEHRYGMTPRRFDSIDEFVRYLCDYQCYVLPAENRPGHYKQVNRPFTQYVTTTDPDRVFQEFLWHEHYVWNSARARVRQSTIEVRPACQQPANESMAANALILGWVEALKPVAGFLTDVLGPDPWPVMQRYRHRVVRLGLAAQEPVPGMIEKLVEFAEAGLARRGRGEDKLLAPVWERVGRRQSPGVHAREMWRREGVERWLNHVAVR
jgi:gamma-glutamylcysteine synthetase